MFALPLLELSVWITVIRGRMASLWCANPARHNTTEVLTSRGPSQFMHNGGIADFHKIKRKLQTSVRDEVFDWVTGNTGRPSQYHVGGADLMPPRFPMGVCSVSVEGELRHASRMRRWPLTHFRFLAA